MDWIGEPEAWLALGTLTVLEVVLGIDNIVFISILSSRLRDEQQKRARLIGLGLAMLGRIVLLFSLAWVMGLTADLFSVFGQGISGRDMILTGGGLFLLGKATTEIHAKLEGTEEEDDDGKPASFGAVLGQIVLLDAVFSLDSVITAVGMADHLGVMVTAVIIAVVIMMLLAETVSSFIEQRPTVKMLALSFLLLIGTALVADGLDLHIPKGYIYFAMAFSVFVELLNLRLRSTRHPVHLHGRGTPRAPAPKARRPEEPA